MWCKIWCAYILSLYLYSSFPVLSATHSDLQHKSHTRVSNQHTFTISHQSFTVSKVRRGKFWVQHFAQGQNTYWMTFISWVPPLSIYPSIHLSIYPSIHLSKLCHLLSQISQHSQCMRSVIMWEATWQWSVTNINHSGMPCLLVTVNLQGTFLPSYQHDLKPNVFQPHSRSW